MKEGDIVGLLGGTMLWSTTHATMLCEEVQIVTEVTENSTNPAVLNEAPGEIMGCYLSQNPLRRVLSKQC